MKDERPEPESLIADTLAPATDQPALRNYVDQALKLNGLVLPAEEIARTAAEFERGLEIIAPLLGFELPDRLDLAGTFRA